MNGREKRVVQASGRAAAGGTGAVGSRRAGARVGGRVRGRIAAGVRVAGGVLGVRVLHAVVQALVAALGDVLAHRRPLAVEGLEVVAQLLQLGDDLLLVVLDLGDAVLQ